MSGVGFASRKADVDVSICFGQNEKKLRKKKDVFVLPLRDFLLTLPPPRTHASKAAGIKSPRKKKPEKKERIKRETIIEQQYESI
jgi:hypothetical protein